MKNFFKDSKGAVTVFVAASLIPAILFSGISVDVARAYAGRSMIQNANALAANAALTQYDALLQDLYGLYAITEGDAVLNKMVTEYINLSIYGSTDGYDESVNSGTFQIFNGEQTITPSVSALQGVGGFNHNLSNPEILRRQIEEYAKYRVPVVLIEELLDRLDFSLFAQTAKNSQIISNKMKADKAVEKILKEYTDLYNAIVNADQNYSSKETEAFNIVNNKIQEIYTNISAMYELQNQYKETVALQAELNEQGANTENNESSEETEGSEEQDDEQMIPEIREITPAEQAEYDRIDLITLFDAQKANTLASINGGMYTTVIPGRPNIDPTADDYDPFKGEWIPAQKIASGYQPSLQSKIEDANDKLTEGHVLVTSVNSRCTSIAQNQEALFNAYTNLENNFASGGHTQSVEDGLREPIETEDTTDVELSPMDTYESLSQTPVGEMGSIYYEKNSEYIDDVKNTISNVQYGNPEHSNFTMSFSDLVDEVSSFSVDVPEKESGYNLSEFIFNSLLLNYEAPQEYSRFDDESFVVNKGGARYTNAEFYTQLETLVSSESYENGKETQEKEEENATSLISDVKSEIKRILDVTPNGALSAPKVPNAQDLSAPQKGSFMAADSDEGFSDADTAQDTAINSLDDDFITNLASAAEQVASKGLVIGYATEMFSNFTTNAEYENAKSGESVEPEVTMANIPLNTKVNYFYQSELEFIYNGSYTNAKDNIAVVMGWISLVRFVCNYISSFVIGSVNSELTAIGAAAGPFALIVRELARLGYALAETALDMITLKEGNGTPLLKMNSTEWSFSVAGAKSIPTKLGLTSGKSTEDGFKYIDYLRVMLLLKNEDEITQNISSLITYNMINYKAGIGAPYAGNGELDESAQADMLSKMTDAIAAEGAFNPNTAITDYKISTTATLDMLFLSQPLFTRELGEYSPPGTVQLTIEDARGY